VNHKRSRKRGGQSGNHNALKHGFYSSRLNPLRATVGASPASPGVAPVNAEVPNVQDIDNEISLIRTLISRHLELRQAHPAASPEESLTDLRVISFSVARLTSLVRLRANSPADSLAKSAQIGKNDDWLRDIMEEFPHDPNAPIQ